MNSDLLKQSGHVLDVVQSGDGQTFEFFSQIVSNSNYKSTLSVSGFLKKNI